MMRKEGLIKYTIFLLVCFFSLIVTSFAAEDGGTFQFIFNEDTEYIDVTSKLEFSEIISIGKGSNSDYIDLQCTGAGNCKAYLLDMYKEHADEIGSVTAAFEIFYRKAGSETDYVALVTFNIYPDKSAKLWPSGVGTCNYDGWESVTHRSSSGQQYHFYKAENRSLPSCQSGSFNGMTLEFKGWVPNVSEPTDISDNAGNLYAFGTCKGAVSANTPAQASTYYAPCYEYKDYFVRLSLSTGSVNASGWTANSNFGSEYYYKGSSPNDTIALPDVTFSGFSEGKSLQCWKKNGTGNCLDPGTSVKTDGSTYVAVVNTEHREYSYYKSVRVNKSVVFAVEGMKSCSLASGQPSGYIDVSMSNGDCMVAGLKETTVEGETTKTYIDVNIELEGGNKKVYKFSVESDAGITAAGNGEFIVNPTVNSGEENSHSDSSEFKSASCTRFHIKLNDGLDLDHGLHSFVYSVDPIDCDGDYSSLCLDPGLQSPSGSEIYEKVDDIKPGTKLYDLISYLVGKFDLTIFKEPQNKQRAAAHIASRIVAVQDGMQATSGIIFAKHHQIFQDVASEISSRDSSDYAAIIRDNITSDLDIYELAGEILANYQSNSSSEESENGGFERTIESSEAVPDGSGYTITYKGTITAPAAINLSAPTGSIGGVNFEVSQWDGPDDTGDGRVVYNYIVKIHAPVTTNVVPPTTEEEKLAMSFKISFTGNGATGGQSVSNVFIASPTNTARSVQRMLVFNTGSSDVYIYFNIAPNNCELPGLDYTKCTGPDSCDKNVFNAKLFKASGCCRYVTDEATYEYVVQNICSAKCTTSTMSNVCDYSTFDNIAELYEIKEGSEYNGSATGEGSGYVNAIATCVTNVDQDIANYGSNYGEIKEIFQKNDDNGNSISVKHFESNKYCRVNCKEDWQISMDGFGNYVGEKAIAAGSYFQIANDIFIGGKRTCFTNYVDYNRYMNDVVKESDKLVDAYNEYSNLSHAWSDIDKQELPPNWDDTSDTSAGGLTSQEHVLYKHVHTEEWQCPPDDPDTKYYNEHVNDCKSVDTSPAPEPIGYYYTYELNVNHEFQGEDDEKGKYQKYDTVPDPDSKESFMNSGSGETVTELDNKDGVATEYDVEGQGMTIDITTKDPTCTASAGNPTCRVEENDIYNNTKNDDGVIIDDYGTTINPIPNSAELYASAAFKQLKEEMLKRLEEDMQDYRSDVANGAATIKMLVNQMYDCQHFQLDNKSGGEGMAATENLAGKYYKTTLPYVKIPTAFDPDVTYNYAEDAFMTILLNNKENYLEPYDEKNDSIYGGEGSYKSATNRTEKTTIKLNDSTDVEVNLARNFLEFNYYKVDEPWEPKEKNGRDYKDNSGKTTNYAVAEGNLLNGSSGAYKTTTISLCGISGDGDYSNKTADGGVDSGTLVPDEEPKWTKGECFDSTVPYLDANYISASIENSSFYKNQGSWYDNAKDVKAHGAGLKKALENENANNNSGYNVANELSSGRWTPVGIINVFPISITTPRNLYTYTYTFKDIGSLYDGDLGRIMGDENAIIANNNRTCFYEVFEELCLCCGDKINTYVFNDPDENDLIEQLISASGYTPSNVDKMEENKGGTLSFATTTVNLSDIDVDENLRPVATNWSDNSPFTYGGEYNLSTSKGEQLKNAIESQGETIYSSNSDSGGPEYAYYLTPTTLTKIREYNDAHGYELNFNNLKVYGRYSIAALKGCSDVNSDSCWSTDAELMNDEIINFQHYGSVFLEDLAKDPNIVKANTLARAGNENVCLVVDNQFNADTINSLVKNEKCRWIDFVENLGDNGGKGKTSYTYPHSAVSANQENVTYFRLAFK